MINHKPLGWLIAESFMAVVARELSVLPASNSGVESRSTRFWSATINWLTKVTADIGFGVSYLVGFRPHRGQGFVSNGKVRAPAPAGEDVNLPALEVVEACPKRPAPTWDRSLADRKFWLLKRSGLFGDDAKGAQIGRACSLDDLRKAYKLVHEVYLGTGFIEPEAAGMRLRIFETTPDMATFVARIDGRVVGVLSILTDTPELGLPSDAAFREELDALRVTGQRLCEITNQAVAKDYRKSAVPTELMRCAMAHATASGFDEIVATVSPSHGSFYELLGFREIGSERTYSEKLHDPVVTLGMKVDQYRQLPSDLNETEKFIHHFLAAGNHYIPHVEKWADEARENFLNADLLAQLFVAERNFIEECTPTQLKVLQDRWGHELFSEVTGGLFIPSTEKLMEAALPTLATSASGNP